MTPLPGDLTSLSLAVKMQSSKRTLRSHEIPINGANLLQQGTASNASASLNSSAMGGANAGNNALTIMQQGNSPNVNDRMMNSSGGQSNISGVGGGTGNAQHSSLLLGTPGNIGNSGIGTAGMMISGGGVPLAETELDLNFSLQYPHFIKRDGNRCV